MLKEEKPRKIKGETPRRSILLGSKVTLTLKKKGSKVTLGVLCPP
jgi:hypothetical protein